MVFDIEIRLQGFFRSPYDINTPPTIVLHIHWNGWRRIFRRTHTGILPPEDELLGPSASALFGFRFGPVSDLHIQIVHLLATLHFRPSVCNFISHKITAFAIGFGAARPGPPYPSTVIFANLNFIEKFYFDYTPIPPAFSQFRQLAAARFLGETFVLGTSMEDTSGVDEEETAGDEGVSDSAIEMIRRRKSEWRGGSEENCSICLETFLDGEEVIPLRCDHVYHESCIVTWLMKSRSCPLCRGEI